MSRYPPPHEQRYIPRERSRSPPRFGDRRPSAAFGSQFPGRNPPSGPRGRGAPFYNDAPDARGPPPVGGMRDRPFREREFDRRGRPPSPPLPLPPPRARSPPRNFRDAPSPRELDVNRPRRNSRDGPFSAGPTFNDPPPFASQGFARGGFGASRGRGRGRGDFDFRDRARRPPPFEDRSTFRPRERTPPGRWTREDTRENREEWRGDRIERPDDDRWSDRDVREREANWFRRESNGPRFEARQDPPISSRPPTPHQPPQISQPPPAERPSVDVSRDGNEGRRPSTSLYPPTLAKDPRQDSSPQNVRASPPPQAPSVPAFGSVSFKAPPYSGPTSNVWRPSNEIRQPPSPAIQPQRAPSPVPKTAPTGPRAQAPPQSPIIPPSAPLGPKVPLEAPKAPRALEPRPVPGFRESAPPVKPSNAPLQIPTGPAALRNEERLTQPSNPPQTREWSAPAQPAGPMSKPPAAVWSISPSQRPARDLSGEPSQSIASSISDRKPPSGPPAPETKFPRTEAAPLKLETPPPTAPSGPRAHAVSTSPQMATPGIPTAPKADRAPPTGPRGSTTARPPINAPRGPAWNQWRAPGLRDNTVLPAKRDANGEEKELTGRTVSISTHSSENTSPAVKDDPSSVSAQELRRPSNARSSFGEQYNRLPSMEQQKSATRVELDDMEDQVEVPISDSDDSSDDDDGMDLDESDVETRRLNFEQQKARLQSQLVDLSDRQYRATTPLEQLARLAKITVGDLPTTAELSSMADAPELDREEHSRTASHDIEDADQDLLTPKEEEAEAEDVVMESNDTLDHVLPPPTRRKIPQVINLPYLLNEPMSPHDSLQEHMSRQNDTKAAVLAHLQDRHEEEVALEEDLDQKFVEMYRAFKRTVYRFDDQKAEKERLERQKSADTGPDLDAGLASLEASTSESSRRLHKFSSEYDIQKVLKESEETARIEQERLEREAQKARDSLEKEAELPEKYDREMQQRRVFRNMNNFRNAWHLTDVYGYQPPADDFSEEEHRIFLVAFKDRPKKWGEIAAKLPGRTYQHCIHHYYAFKWDGRFRETKGRRKRGIGRARGGKPGTRNRGAALMADLGPKEEDVNGTAGTESGTTSGRPRRAAASRTVTQTTELEPKQSGATQGRRAAKGAEVEAGGEKPVKRRKGAAGEKVPRKTKTQQPLAAAAAATAAATTTTTTTTATSTPAAPIGSPVKTERDVQFRTNELSAEDLARVEEASLLAGLQSGTRAPQTAVPVYHAEGFFQPSPAPVPPTAESTERSRASAAQSSQSRSAASSYWSVPEQQDFVKFLGFFGTDFGSIASHMGTKTQTMVKNHFQRHTDGGNRPDLIEIAEIANGKRARGEDMGIPPTPTPIVKRRYDAPQSSSLRAGHVEGIEAEEAAASNTAAAVLASQSRFSANTVPTPSQQRLAPTPLQPPSSASVPKGAAAAAPRPTQSLGPKMGFFTDSRPESRPSMTALGGSRRLSQPPPSQPSQQSARGGEVSDSWYKNLILEQERALTMQREQEQRLSQERVPTLAQHHPSVYPSIASQSSRPGDIPRRPSTDERPTTPSGLPPTSRPGSTMLRQMLGSPQPPKTTIPTLPAHMHPSQNPSPPKTLGFRPSSVPVPMQSPVSAPLKPALPAEPRKTSNLASLLNSEPEDPRPKKRQSDQTVQLGNRPQSPANLTRNPTPTGQPPMFAQRRETIGSASAPRSFYDRPSQSTPAPTPPAPKHEPAVWSNLPPARREEWNARGSVIQAPPPSSSPNPMQLDRDRAFYSHRGSALGGLGGASRVNPSPPPHGHSYMGHSRTSSFSHGTPPQQHPPPAGQPMQQLPPRGEPPQSKSSSVLQPNPYAQPPGPAAHIQQMQAQQQQQQQPPIHPSYSQMQDRHSSRDESIARENDRMYRERIDYERREAAYAAEQQQHQQHRFAQHRGPPQAMHTHNVHPNGPPPPGYQSMQNEGPPRLSLREQAQREGMAGYREAQWRLEREREQEFHRHEDVERRRRDEEMRSHHQQQQQQQQQGPPGGFGGYRHR